MPRFGTCKHRKQRQTLLGPRLLDHLLLLLLLFQKTGEMEVKNPLFKEDFSASSQNLFASPSLSTLPPAYSSLGSQTAVTSGQPAASTEQPSSSAAESSKETAKLIQIDSAVPEPAAAATTTVTVESENTATTPKQ